MNTAAASVISASPVEPPIWNRIRKTSEFLTKLSLNAEKNWHQNKGAKRRVIRREDDMGSYGKRPSRPMAERPVQTTIWAKGQHPGSATGWPTLLSARRGGRDH